MQEDTAYYLQGETVVNLQEEYATPLQGKFLLPEHSQLSQPSSSTLLTLLSTRTDNDNMGNISHILPTTNVGEQLKPRSRNPPSRYGEWIKYDDNRSKTGSAAFVATRSERIPEPKTYQEAMQSPHA